MTPQQHAEQAETLLAEARNALQNLPSDPRDQRGDRRLAVAQLAATRAIGHALLAQRDPQVSIGPLAAGGSGIDGGRP